MILKFPFLGACLIGIAAFQVQAETVEVGRATIELPEGNWQALTTNEGKTTLDGGASGSLPTDDRAFVLMFGDQMKAILYVSSSKGGSTIRTNWTNTCKASDSTYAASLTTNPNALECERATGALKTDVYLKMAMPNVLKALEEKRLAPPPIVQSTSATVGNDRGTMLHVNLLAAPTFTGLQSEEILSVPTRVKPGHAAWAHQLILAIKDSVYSMSGKMAVPPVVFAAPRATSSTTQ